MLLGRIGQCLATGFDKRIILFPRIELSPPPVPSFLKTREKEQKQVY
jgi:hypothetical protein